ncbi:predicted protein [Nematostella vectensis]|uniref:Glutaredoxin domain-containing protein n=1 Tax=Nematostella vectensis TaxID=45351 RepID=A7SXB8_NEMVE|nr:glutaredoxin-C8 [Nematostella vectensis]EDO31649.1 predicted protein [Nematostella vectensis]|eukprot:XP_001623749.1 predicted protein [Nematostella vectensis]
MAAKTALHFVRSVTRSNNIVVFSKTACSFSIMAKKLLRDVGVSEMVVYELEQREDGHFIQDALKELTGRGTVPNVFVKGQSIGGGMETAELYQSGKLKQLLQDHGLLDENQ